MSTAGLVLAGGSSSRMGRDKALLKQGDETLLERNSRILKQAGCARVYISGNCNGNRQQTNAINDIREDLGPVGGILSAMQQLLTSDHRWLVIIAVDMPNLSPAQLQPLFDNLSTTSNGRYFNDSLFPMIIKIDRQLAATIAQQLSANNKKAKSVYRLVHNLALEALCANEVQVQQFINVNTPEQWQRHLLSQQQAQLTPSKRG